MKRYKLIREYPGSPKLGTIEEIPELSVKTFTIGIWQYFISSCLEYWEEVIEKDYEILSVISDISGIIYYNSIDSRLSQNYPKHNIYSVKRLSDGEIFTIGDEIEFNYLNSTKCPGIISEFKLYGNRLCFIESILNYNSELNIIGKKIKLPLFTTEDGVDIFEGDSFYPVNFHDLKGEKYKALKDSVNWDRCKRFSTKEAAEEYKLMNKPCLSIKDLEIINRNYNGCILVSRKDLKRLVNGKSS